MVTRVETVTQMRSLRVAQDEVDLADRLPVDAVGEHRRPAVARHHLETIGPEVGDQDVAAAGERQAVGQRAFEIAAGLRRRLLKVLGVRLGDQLLTARRDADHPAAGIGRPERAVRFGEDALRTLQAFADIAERAPVDAKIQNRIPAHFAAASGSANATYAGTAPAPARGRRQSPGVEEVAFTRKNWRPLASYIAGIPRDPAGSAVVHSTLPVSAS